MATRFWIKLYIEMLYDPKLGRLPNHLWRRAVELFLLAGREGNDGALPPVEEMAWILRLPEEKVLEDLHGLAEAGVVHTCATTAGTSLREPDQWMVTDFAKQQAAVPVEERVRQFRERNGGGQIVTKRYKRCNEEGEGEGDSNSTSTSLSESFKEEDTIDFPNTPKEAMDHPDVKAFAAVTDGRIPGAAQYQAVIEAVRLVRAREKLDEEGLREYLAQFWLAWSGRKRKDGRPYDPGNITWLTEWALNGAIPLQGLPEATRPAVPTPEETRRMLAEKDEILKQAVPMPEEIRAKLRGLAKKMGGKEDP